MHSKSDTLYVAMIITLAVEFAPMLRVLAAQQDPGVRKVSQPPNDPNNCEKNCEEQWPPP